MQAQLGQLKLLNFARTCFALCEAWFGVDLPIPSDPLDESFFTYTTDKLFRDGIFGLTNEQNEAAHTAKELKHAAAPYWVGAAKLTLRNLFPPYRDMQLIPWYRFVDGRPWLMPAAWVYRWGYCLTHKGSASVELLSEPFARRETVEERQRYIQDWGL